LRLYRITKQAWLEDYQGRGGDSYRHGARFNLANTPVLYFSETPAVAMLEMGHYLPSPQLVPASYRLGVYQLPDDVAQEEIALSDLPPGWHQYPSLPAVQQLGDHRLQQGHSLIIWLPTAAVQPFGSMRNAMVNPLHPDISKLKLIDAIADFYNPRLFTG